MAHCQQSYRLLSAAHGLSHGLKIARQLSIFAPVCALVPPFQVLVPAKKSNTILIVFIGTFCDMTIIGHQGGQRTAVRLGVFMPTIAYLYFRQGE